jgi:hypothetical protein
VERRSNPVTMDIALTKEELAAFLDVANKETYANKSAPKVVSLRPGSEDYHFTQGDLEYHDTYFGSRDFIGAEVVYKKKSPIWGMNYYGCVLDAEVSESDVYDFLRKALLQEYGDILPVRGPQKYVKGVWMYDNTVTGTLNRFVGTETISLSGKVVYTCEYHGGLVS